MPAADKAILDQLTAQLRADPRAQQWIAEQKRTRNWARGSYPMVPNSLLRQWGYNVPDGYAWTGGALIRPGDHGLAGKIIAGAGAGILGLGALGAAGVGPLAGGSSPAAAGTNAAIDTSIGGGAGLTTAAPAAVTAVNGGAAVGAAAMPSFMDALTNPQNLLGLGTTAAALFANRGGGSGNPFSSDEERAIYDEIRRGLQLQRQRVEQTQPVFDRLVQRSNAYAPNQSYGGPAYAYQGPRFGG